MANPIAFGLVFAAAASCSVMPSEVSTMPRREPPARVVPCPSTAPPCPVRQITGLEPGKDVRLSYGDAVTVNQCLRRFAEDR